MHDQKKDVFGNWRSNTQAKEPIYNFYTGQNVFNGLDSLRLLLSIIK